MTQSRFSIGFLLSALTAVALAITASANGERELFADDFSKLPAGWLSSPVGTLNGAIQEYHYLPHRGVPLGKWENAICHLDAWIIGDEEGTSFLEQHTLHPLPELSTPMFVTGDPEWQDYRSEVRVRPLNTLETIGLVFRYHTNRHYYMLALTGGDTAKLVVRLPVEKTYRIAEWRELAKIPFSYDTTRYYTLAVQNEGAKITAFIDGKAVMDASDSEIMKGKTGVAASVPARFQKFRVTTSAAAAAAIDQRIARARARSREAARRQSEAEGVEEVFGERLWRGPQHPPRRSRRRRSARHADRAEHSARARRRLRSHQRADGDQFRRQDPVADGPSRRAQRAAHQRYVRPDS